MTVFTDIDLVALEHAATNTINLIELACPPFDTGDNDEPLRCDLVIARDKIRIEIAARMRGGQA